jgi:hypothetical protein
VITTISQAFTASWRIAHNRRNDPGFATLNGDLNQMSIQAEALRANGFEIGFSDVYPVVKTEDDFKRALKFLWDREVPGWWHYQERMIEYGICTKESWRNRLEAYSKRTHEAATAEVRRKSG